MEVAPQNSEAGTLQKTGADSHDEEEGEDMDGEEGKKCSIF
jgi:hypothetical protein